ncbi:MAG: sialidase family protein, partial [Methanobacteriota archaeon]
VFISGDADVAVDSGGVVYLVLSQSDMMVRASLDRGETFGRPRAASGERTATEGGDRPWLAGGGPREAYLLWYDHAACRFTKTEDAGVTFRPAVDAVGYASNCGPVSRGPTGRLMFATVGNGLFVTSTDDGETWDSAKFTSTNFGNGLPVAVEDDSGTAYVAYIGPGNGDATMPGGAKAVFLAASKDGGETFRHLRLSRPETSNVFPWAVAGAAGRVAVAWLEGVPLAGPPTDSNVGVAMEWYVRVALVEDAASAPAITLALADPRPVHRGAICGFGVFCSPVSTQGLPGDRRLLDFFEIDADQHGNVFIAYGRDPDDARVEGADLTFVRQVDGPTLR